MKLKLLAIVLGSIVLGTPLVLKSAWAQTTASPIPLMTGVELTQQQETQLAQIRRQTWTQIQQILSREQLNEFKAAMEQGAGLRGAIAAMNLSPEQKTQLRQVFQSGRQQMGAVLRPEQKQQFRQNLRNRISQFRTNRLK